MTYEVIQNYDRTWGEEVGTNNIMGWLVNDRDEEWSRQVRVKHHEAGILIGVEKCPGSGTGNEEMDSSSLSRTGEGLGFNPTYQLPS